MSAAPITGSHRRTLDAVFRHPTAHNLEWSDVVALAGKLGRLHEQSNDKYVFELAADRLVMRKPHSKDLTTDDVLALRQFIMKAGLSPDHRPEAESNPVPAGEDYATPNLVVVVDHHGARIFHVDVASGDTSEHVIKPYDPHHYLHHLMHKDQSRERGQRSPEEPAYYDKIAATLAHSGKIVVVGHGDGKSNAAHHLIDYLKAHHTETYQRVVREVVADLSATTPPQLLELARQALDE